MHYGGRAPADRPDPRDDLRSQARSLGLHAAALVPQRHLEDWGISGLQASQDGGPGEMTTRSVTLSRMYTVWRNPDDHADPVNLRPLDDDLRRMQEETIPDDLPAWIVWMRDRGRYPSLWEAVHTHWSAPEETTADLPALLTAHVDHVLHNSFRREYGLGDPTEEPWTRLVQRSAVQSADVIVDGAVVEGGMMIDTDAFVFGVDAPLPDGRILTAVLSRDLLDLVTLEFVADGPDEPSTPVTATV